jgi:hypothetical protein
MLGGGGGSYAVVGVGGVIGRGLMGGLEEDGRVVVRCMGAHVHSHVFAISETGSSSSSLGLSARWLEQPHAVSFVFARRGRSRWP